MRNKLTAKILLTSAATLFVLTCSPFSFGQTGEWAVKMFSASGTERMHNFGSVALHADVEKRFEFTNIYDEDVVISSVSSNCGCTKASVSKQVIHPGEKGEVIARVDTSGREHTKQRRATIRVVFSKPTAAEVQLQVKTYIRPDVGFDPGVIEFGTVSQGTRVVKKAHLQFVGRSDWGLIGIQKSNPGIRAEARELRRQNGKVDYEITIELKADASPGYIHDLLRFQTNETDATTSSIFLPVQGLVVEPLSAKPSYLQLGVVSPGKKVTRNIVVSGSEPFKILGIHSSDSRVTGEKTDLKRTVHVLPITFSPGEKTGAIDGTIEIETSQVDENGDHLILTVDTTGVVIDRDGVPTEKPSVARSSATRTSLQEPSRNKGIPVIEPLAPAPLNELRNKTRSGKDASGSEATIRKLESSRKASDDSISTNELIEVVDDEEEEVQFAWQPVRNADIRHNKHHEDSVNSGRSGEWISDWKAVESVEKPELISSVPTKTILK